MTDRKFTQEMLDEAIEASRVADKDIFLPKGTQIKRGGYGDLMATLARDIPMSDQWKYMDPDDFEWPGYKPRMGDYFEDGFEHGVAVARERYLNGVPA